MTTEQEYQAKIAELEAALQKKEQEMQDKEEIWGRIRHDLNSKFHYSMGYARIESQKEDVPQRTKKILSNMGKNSEIGSILLKMSKLNGLSQKELRENTGDISLNENLRKIVLAEDLEMKNCGIAYNLSYDNPATIKVYSPLFLEIFETMMGNCLNHAKSEINQAINVSGSGVEVLTENNALSESRRIYGLNEGTSLEFIEKMIPRMGGTISKYLTSKIDKDAYAQKETFGYENAEPIKKDSEVFGIQINFKNKSLEKLV